MQLSKYFGLDELTRSETAAREGIPNVPADGEVANLKALCERVLDPLRDAVGMAIKVNSGYRSVKLNQRLRGASSSQHMQGMAADIQAPGMRVVDLFKRVIELGLPFDQIIYEAQNAKTKWVHVSYSGAGSRGDIRIARFDASGRPIAYTAVTAAQALAIEEPRERGIATVEYDYVEMDDAPSAKPRAPAKKRASGKKRGANATPKGNFEAKAGKPKPTRKAATQKKRPVTKTARATVAKGAKRTAGKAPAKAAKGRTAGGGKRAAETRSVKASARTKGRKPRTR